MKTDYLDDDFWVELARARKVRLPHKTTALTTGGMEKWVRVLKVTDYKVYSGGQGYKAFLQANPLWSMRAFVGLLLERIG